MTKRYVRSDATDMLSSTSAKTRTSQNNVDGMFEFGGPFPWAAKPMARQQPDRISPGTAPQLCAKPTNSPGFVTLHWAQTTRCDYDAPL